MPNLLYCSRQVSGDGNYLNAFYNCTALVAAKFQSLIEISLSGGNSNNELNFLRGCVALQQVEFPNLQKIEISAINNNCFNNFMRGCAIIEEVVLPEIDTIVSNSVSYGGTIQLWAFSGCTNLKRAVFPKLVNVYTGSGYATSTIYNYFLSSCASLEYVEMATMLTSPINTEIGYGRNTRIAAFASCPNLIDIKIGNSAIGGELTNNIHILKGWAPANVFADATKNATMNANIRDHIVANLRDLTGLESKVFYLNTNMQSHLEQATLDAFAAKNWTVAYSAY